MFCFPTGNLGHEVSGSDNTTELESDTKQCFLVEIKQAPSAFTVPLCCTKGSLAAVLGAPSVRVQPNAILNARRAIRSHNNLGPRYTGSSWLRLWHWLGRFNFGVSWNMHSRAWDHVGLSCSTFQLGAMLRAEGVNNVSSAMQ